MLRQNRGGVGLGLQSDGTFVLPGMHDHRPLSQRPLRSTPLAKLRWTWTTVHNKWHPRPLDRRALAALHGRGLRTLGDAAGHPILTGRPRLTYVGSGTRRNLRMAVDAMLVQHPNQKQLLQTEGKMPSNDLYRKLQERGLVERTRQFVFTIEVVLPEDALEDEDRAIEDALDSFRARGSAQVLDVKELGADDERRL